MANRTVYGYSESENDWPMVDEFSCNWVTIPGCDPQVTIQVQQGIPTVLLRALVADLNAYVQKVRDADTACWTRQNSVGSSNHLSGTAVDVDWDDHPMGPEYAGWTTEQIAEIRRIISFYTYRGVQLIWWGEDWTTPKDSMHFQVGYFTYGNQDICNEFISKFIRPDGFSTYRRDGAAPAPAPAPSEMTVPLVDNGDGTWGSPSPAWDHLIKRESSGNPTIIQQIIDVNSGGNEAEGLFQITPRTWQAHNGTEFAASPRLATPQQQAIVAARIFTSNPSGSDWGAGLPGREDAAQLAAGLVPTTGTSQGDEDEMSGWTPELVERAMVLLENQTGVFRPSVSPLRHLGEGNVNTCGGFAQSADGLGHPQFVLMAARLGHTESIDLIGEVAGADLERFADRAEDKKLATAMLTDLKNNYPHVLEAYIAAKGQP